MKNVKDKDNKLIADFMNMKYGEERKFENKEWTHTISSLNRFRTDWNWLMPVIKKLDSYANEHMTFAEYDDYRNSNWKMIDNPSKYDITNVFKQVVQFITWYNERK